MKQTLNIIFAGTPEFSVAPLQALLDSHHRVVAVYTQPDRPAGRGRALRPSPVKEKALQHGLPVYQPKTLRDDNVFAEFSGIEADLMVVVAYGLILPQNVLDAPRLGCLNIHASLLPRWRGAAPIQRAIEAGDPETGITIMQMEAGLDTGPMLLRKSLSIGEHETAGQLHDRLAVLGAEALGEALQLLADNALNGEIQDEAQVTYAGKLDKQEALIDWSLPAIQIERRIRAFNPWPVAFTRHAGKNLRIWCARAETSSGNAEALPGSVVGAPTGSLRVATGDGVLDILELQPEGRRRMAAADFLNAHSLTGSRFD